MAYIETEKILISTDELAIGMYVSQLDRPWLETPFLFQGFLIATAKETEQLRRYCRHVFVDVKRSADGVIVMKRAQTRPLTFGRRLVQKLLGRRRPVSDPVTRTVYRNKVSLSAELPKATRAHDTASTVMGDVMRTLREGGGLQVTEVREAVRPMIDTVLRNEFALAWLTRLRTKDDYAYQHSVATGVYSLVLGRHLGLDRDNLELLGMGGLLLDVGLTRIPDELLRKKETLTAEEVTRIRTHVEAGVEILTVCKGLDARVVEMVRTHHERYNGSGYPRGLSNGDIPVFGRIAGIVDSFHAMTTPRPFADPMSPCEAMMHLNNLADVEFQAELVEQFVQAVGCFPTGTLVELNSGEVGVVTSQNRVRRLRPRVMIVLGADKQRLGKFREVDLRNETADLHTQNSLWITRGLEPGAYGIDPAEFYL